MKRTLLSLIASLAVAGTFAAAQESQPSSRPQPSQEQQRDPAPTPSPSAAQSSQKSSDMTLTGCLVQGSSPSVFILENAKTSTDSATAKGKSYVIQAAAGTDLKEHLNHQVRIVGSEGAGSSSSSASSSMSGAQSSPSSSSSSSPSSSSSSRPGSSASGASSSSQSAQSSASSQTDERSLPRLSARTVTMVANTCPAA